MEDRRPCPEVGPRNPHINRRGEQDFLPLDDPRLMLVPLMMFYFTRWSKSNMHSVEAVLQVRILNFSWATDMCVVRCSLVMLGNGSGL